MTLENLLYLDLLWIGYKEALDRANKAILSGNKLGALVHAIDAHKLKSQYESKLGDFIIGLC